MGKGSVWIHLWFLRQKMKTWSYSISQRQDKTLFFSVTFLLVTEIHHTLERCLHLILRNHLETTTNSMTSVWKIHSENYNKHLSSGRQWHRRGRQLFSYLYRENKYQQCDESHSVTNQQLTTWHSKAEFISAQAQSDRNISSVWNLKTSSFLNKW